MSESQREREKRLIAEHIAAKGVTTVLADEDRRPRARNVKGKVRLDNIIARKGIMARQLKYRRKPDAHTQVLVGRDSDDWPS